MCTVEQNKPSRQPLPLPHTPALSWVHSYSTDTHCRLAASQPQHCSNHIRVFTSISLYFINLSGFVQLAWLLENKFTFQVGSCFISRESLNSAGMKWVNGMHLCVSTNVRTNIYLASCCFIYHRAQSASQFSLIRWSVAVALVFDLAFSRSRSLCVSIFRRLLNRRKALAKI